MEQLYRPNLAGSVRDLLAISKIAQMSLIINKVHGRYFAEAWCSQYLRLGFALLRFIGTAKAWRCFFKDYSTSHLCYRDMSESIMYLYDVAIWADPSEVRMQLSQSTAPDLVCGKASTSRRSKTTYGMEGVSRSTYNSHSGLRSLKADRTVPRFCIPADAAREHARSRARRSAREA